MWSRTVRESSKLGEAALERRSRRQERSFGVRIQRVPNTRAADRATWKNCNWEVVGGGLMDVTSLAGQCGSTCRRGRQGEAGASEPLQQ